MRIVNTIINGLKIIHLEKILDSRGGFVKVFNEEFFMENNLKFSIKENYFSISSKNVIRGMHFQVPPFEHAKLVYVNHGEILDVVLDIRKSSPTYGQYVLTELNSDKPLLIYIPVGCAHGFLSLKDNSIVSYLQTSAYNKVCDTGILWNSFMMDWKIESPIISERDTAHASFNNFKSPF